MNPSKLHSTLLNELNIVARGDEVISAEEPQYPVIVRLRPMRGADSVAALTTLPPMEMERRLSAFSAVAGKATRTEIEALSQHGAVEMVWLDEPVYALLDRSIPLLGINSVWQGGNEGAGIKVCVIDTGVDADHPDLQGRVIARKDFTGEGEEDGNGHGTHVAGIIGGDGTVSQGRIKGVAPRAEILGAKVLRNDGGGKMSTVIAALEWALDEGAQIANLSLGSRTPSDGTDATSVACNEAVAAGLIVMVAAGNEGPDAGTLNSPGVARDVITVGASTFSDGIATFSSRGPTKDGRIKPDVLLPGDGITSLRAGGTSAGQVVNEYYTVMSGTSMATPHAAGLAALMLTVNSTLKPADVKAIFQQSCKTLGLDPNTQGRGRVQGDVAVRLATPPINQPPTTTPPTPNEGNDGCLGAISRWFRSS